MKTKGFLFVLLTSVLAAALTALPAGAQDAGKRCQVDPQGHDGLCERSANDRTHL